MTEEHDSYSAEVFDPVAFAEWWFEHKWAEKRPSDFRRCMKAVERDKGELDA